MLNIFPLIPSGYYILLRLSPYLLLSLLIDAGAWYLHPFFLLLQLPLVVYTGWYFLHHSSKIYLITPDFFMISRGHCCKKITWLELSNIKDFQFRQTKIMRCLGITDISFISGPDLDITLQFKGVDQQLAKIAITGLIEVLKTRQEFYEKLFPKTTTNHD